MKNKKISLAVIPAREGSKRLINKNIRLIDGHPLIAYTICAVKKSKNVDFWLLSSDSEKIIKIGKKYNAPIYFKRPKNISGDKIRNSETLIHALKFIEKKFKLTVDIILLLQPTSPIRDSRHIDKAIKLLGDSHNGITTLASIKGPLKKRDPIIKKIDKKGHLRNFDSVTKKNLEPFYLYNASIYGVKREYLLKHKKFTSEKQIPLKMNFLQSLDIDDIDDLNLVKSLFKTKIVDKYKINE